MNDEMMNEEGAPEEAPVEAVSETTDEVNHNSKHETALFTGSLGGHVLLDSTSPAG